MNFLKAQFILFLFLISLSCTDQKIDPNQYDIIISIEEVAALYNVKVNTTDTLKKTSLSKYNRSAFKLSYEYHNQLEGAELYYAFDLNKPGKSKDKAYNFGLQEKTLAEEQRSVPGRAVHEVDIDLIEEGIDIDDYYYAFIKEEGDTIGLILAIRKGITELHLFLLGFPEVDDELLVQLVLPKLENMLSFEL